VRRADTAATWAFSRQFFWTAFKALDYNGIDGDYVEFGSHGGMTFSLAFEQIRRRKIQRHMWAFDSFAGLPAGSSPADDHPKWKKGHLVTDVDAFHRICRSRGIPPDAYTTVVGFYEETLTAMADDAPPTNIALAYVDCDMYTSTKTVLEFLAPRLKHGMILAFDDYFCWSADQISGERKALLEAPDFGTKWNLLRYRDYGWAATSFIVERLDRTPKP
jgi:hypothetical protein